MAELKDWSCEFQLATYFPLTVGQKFAILCHGNTPINPKLDPNFDENENLENYELVILRHKYKSSNELFLSTTSWKVGKHNIKKIKLNVGKDYILISPPAYEVKTLLTEKTQMHPPQGPIIVTLSSAYWYMLGLLAIGLIAMLAKVYRDTRKYDRGMLKLNSFKTGLSPFFEFQKQARLAKRTLEKNLNAAELNELTLNIYKQLVTFVSFSLNYPAFVFSEKMVKKRFVKFKIKPDLVKQYFYLQIELKKISFDLKNGSQDLLSIKSDLDILIHDSLVFADKLNKEDKVVKK